MSEHTPPLALRAPLQEFLERLQTPDARASSVTLVVACPGAGMTTALRQLAAPLEARVWMKREIPVWSELQALREAWFSDWPPGKRRRAEPKRDVLLLDQLQPASALKDAPGQHVREFQMDEVARWIARWTGRKCHHVIVGLSHKDHAELLQALKRLPDAAKAQAVKGHQVYGLGRLLPEHYAEPPDPALKTLLEAEDIRSAALAAQWLENHRTRITLRLSIPRTTRDGLRDGLWDELPLPQLTPREQKEPNSETQLPEEWMAAYAEKVLRAMSRSQLEMLLTYCFPVSFPHLASRQATGSDHAKALSILEQSGLLTWPPQKAPRIADPILARYLATRLPRPARLHHISDVHFGGAQGWSDSDTDEPQAPQTRPRAGESDLLTSVKNVLAWRTVHVGKKSNTKCPAPKRYLAAVCDRKPDLVLLSGDVLFRGNRTGGLDLGIKWLQKLQTVLAVRHGDTPTGAPQRLYLVGGNHDVERPDPKYSDEEGRHQLFREKVLTLINGPGDAQDIKNNQLRKRARVDLGIELILLESAIMGGEPNQVIHRLIQSLEEMASWARPLSLLGEEKFNAQRTESTNLANFARDDMGSVDPGMVEPKLIDKLRALDPSLDLVRIAVLHHPISPIPDADTKEYPVVTNATALKRALFRAEVPIVLHGHEHRYHVAAERWSGSTGKIREKETFGNERSFTPEILQISAPTLASTDTAHGQGFVELKIQRELDWLGYLLSVDVTITHHLLKAVGTQFQYEAQAPTYVRVLDKHPKESIRLLPRR